MTLNGRINRLERTLEAGHNGQCPSCGGDLGIEYSTPIVAATLEQEDVKQSLFNLATRLFKAGLLTSCGHCGRPDYTMVLDDDLEKLTRLLQQLVD